MEHAVYIGLKACVILLYRALVRLICFWLMDDVMQLTGQCLSPIRKLQLGKV